MLQLNTLEKISSYSNKMIRLATYYSQNDDKLIHNQLSIINENSPMEDILEAFAKDLDTTAKHIVDAQKMMIGIDSDHNLIELDNNEKNMIKLFGDKYNPNDKSLNIFDINISARLLYEKNTIKNKLAENIIGINFDTFKKLAKVRLEDKKWELYELDSLEDKLDYLSRIEVIENLQNVSKKIVTSADDFRISRRNMSISEKVLIDRNITGSRAMVDSIIQNSTHIDNDEIHQIGSKHKKEKDKVNEIFKLIKESETISEVELDNDSDLDKVIDVIQQVNKLNLNIHNSFTFKVRKLGNYKANGLYLSSENIVAVDLAKPSALIHEITHLIDINNSDLFFSNNRHEMIGKARNYLDVPSIENSSNSRYASYISHPNEIIARLGEISYLLNKYDYKEGSVRDFMDKVSIFQANEKQSATDINISKTVSDYRFLSDIYFEFDDWDSDFANDVKEYYQSYFISNNLELKPVESFDFKQMIKPLLPKKSTTHRTAENIMTGFNPDNIESVFEKNKELNLIDDSTLVNTLYMNIACISRSRMNTKGALARTEYNQAMGTIKKLGDMCEDQDRSNKFKEAVYFNSVALSRENSTLSKKELSEIAGLDSLSKIEDLDLHFVDYMGYKVYGIRLNNYGQKSYNEILTSNATKAFNNLESPNEFILNEMMNSAERNFLFVRCAYIDNKYEFNYDEEEFKVSSDKVSYAKLLKTLSQKVLTEKESILLIKAFDKLPISDELKSDHAKYYFRNLHSSLPLENGNTGNTFDLESARTVVKKMEKQNNKPKNKNNLNLF